MPRRNAVHPEKRKTEKVEVAMDPELRAQLREYQEYWAKKGRKFKISALIRAILRNWLGPAGDLRDPPFDPPPGIDDEKNRDVWRYDE